MSRNRSVLFSLAIAAGAFGCHRDRDAVAPTLPPADNTAPATTGGSTEPGYQATPNAPDQNSQGGTAPGADNATPGTSDNHTPAYPNTGTSSAPGAGTTSSGYGTPASPATPTTAEDRERGTPMNRDNTSGGSMTGGTLDDPSGAPMATDAGVPDDGGTSDAGTKRKKTGSTKGSGGGSGSGSSQ